MSFILSSVFACFSTTCDYSLCYCLFNRNVECIKLMKKCLCLDKLSTLIFAVHSPPQAVTPQSTGSPRPTSEQDSDCVTLQVLCSLLYSMLVLILIR